MITTNFVPKTFAATPSKSLLIFAILILIIGVTISISVAMGPFPIETILSWFLGSFAASAFLYFGYVAQRNTRYIIGTDGFTFSPYYPRKPQKYMYNLWSFQGKILTVKTSLFTKHKTLYIQLTSKAKTRKTIPIIGSEEKLVEIMHALDIALFEYQKAVQQKELLIKNQYGRS